MLRRSLAILTLLMNFGLSASYAADGAKFRALAFSNDGQYFAFEQYGVQDGSGFPYADIFVLDLELDRWVPGTPIRVREENETGGLRATRLKAAQAAKSLFNQLKLDETPEILAANPFTEVVADRNRIRFHDHFNFSMGILSGPEAQGTFDLTLSPAKISTPENCTGETDVQGLKLELRNNKTNTSVVVHEDRSLPASRGCTLGYDIEAIVQPPDEVEGGKLIAIIGVSARGFEGADRRFIAFPFVLNR